MSKVVLIAPFKALAKPVRSLTRLPKSIFLLSPACPVQEKSLPPPSSILQPVTAFYPSNFKFGWRTATRLRKPCGDRPFSASPSTRTPRSCSSTSPSTRGSARSCRPSCGSARGRRWSWCGGRAWRRTAATTRSTASSSR
jgi:hypothetical protein